jgi:hypothetical protein
LPLPIQPGLKAHKSSKGLYGYVEHIITYEPSLVRSLFVCLISHDLSVCYSYGIWAYHLGWLVYSIVLMFILGFTQYPDGEYGDGSTCASNKNIDMCQLDDVLSHAKSDFNFLIGIEYDTPWHHDAMTRWSLNLIFAFTT